MIWRYSSSATVACSWDMAPSYPWLRVVTGARAGYNPAAEEL